MAKNKAATSETAEIKGAETVAPTVDVTTQQDDQAFDALDSAIEEAAKKGAVELVAEDSTTTGVAPAPGGHSKGVDETGKEIKEKKITQKAEPKKFEPSDLEKRVGARLRPIAEQLNVDEFKAANAATKKMNLTAEKEEEWGDSTREYEFNISRKESIVFSMIYGKLTGAKPEERKIKKRRFVTANLPLEDVVWAYAALPLYKRQLQNELNALTHEFAGRNGLAAPVIAGEEEDEDEK